MLVDVKRVALIYASRGDSMWAISDSIAAGIDRSDRVTNLHRLMMSQRQK